MTHGRPTKGRRCATWPRRAKLVADCAPAAADTQRGKDKRKQPGSPTRSRGAWHPGARGNGRCGPALTTLRRLVGRLGPLRLLLLQLDRLRGRLRRFVPPLFPRLVTALAAFVDPGPGSLAERMDEGQENRGVATPAAGDAVSVADHTNAFPAQSRMRAKGRMSHSGVISGWSRTLLAAFPDAGILRRTGLPAAWSCVAPARSTSWPRS